MNAGMLGDFSDRHRIIPRNVSGAQGVPALAGSPRTAANDKGRSRGPAPIADLTVSPGTHFVRLDCAPLGEAISQNVRVTAGEIVTISGDFTGAQGRILVRRGSNP